MEKLIRKFKCYICEGTTGSEYFSLDNYPAYIVPLPPDIAPQVVKAYLPLYACSTCGHMQVPIPDENVQKLIYEEYYNYYVVDSAEAFAPHYRTPFANFIDNLIRDEKLPFGHLLEIGCSSGEQAEYLGSFSKSYTGIDPSGKIKSAIQKHPDHKFIQGYFPDAIPDHKFDVFVSQFNLEHILDITFFLQNIYAAANKDAILLIQVPDCEYFLRTQQPNFMAHEHIQYFIKDTLEILLRKNGFSPIRWGPDGPSLIVAAVKSEPKYAIDSWISQTTIEKVKTQTKIFNSYPANIPQESIFYGVGPQLYWLLDRFNDHLRNISIVDDNPNYQFQGLPGYNYIIEPFSAKLLREKKHIVLSLNKIYHEQVLAKILSFKESCTVQYIKDNAWETVII